jgi:hypothetical protein
LTIAINAHHFYATIEGRTHRIGRHVRYRVSSEC